MSKQRAMWLLILVGCVCGCEASFQPAPLLEALRAVQAGDRALLQLARDKAERASEAAEGGDDIRCVVDYEAFRKRAELAAVITLDSSILFSADENERLVYALNVVRAVPFVPPYDHTCPPLSYARQATLQLSRQRYRVAATALGKFMTDWIAAQEESDGKEYNANMSAAAARLTGSGLESQWPPPTQCVPYAGSCH